MSLIPLFKVRMSGDAAERVNAVLASGYIGQGPEVESFEDELMMALDAPTRPVTVNSCTSAITLALHLIGVRPGDEVITTPLTCTATNSPIVTLGAVPVWADIDPLTGLIDPQDVARKITPRTRAIIAVDWSGRPADYRWLRGVAPGIPIIEDAAHRFGFNWKYTGDYVCMSFQAIKFLTTGDGGALILTGQAAAQEERARLLRWYGLDRTGPDFRCAQNIREVGYKFHMNDIAAAIGRANLEKLPRDVGTHKINAKLYDVEFRGIEGLVRPPWSDASNWWTYHVLVRDRPAFVEWMTERRIQVSQVHARNDKHIGFRYPNGPLPHVDEYDAKQVAIPVGWWLSNADIARVIAAVKGFFNQ